MLAMVPAEEVKVPRCRLLELPEELQLQIYELVVIAKGPIRIPHRLCDGYQLAHGLEKENEIASPARFFSERKQPALSKTCRSIRNIVLPIYYKGNSFRGCCCYKCWWHCGYPVWVYSVSRNWLLSMGATNRALLKDFEVHGEPGTVHTAQDDASGGLLLTQGMQGLKLHACTQVSTPSAMIKIFRQQITFVG
ncbi:hypothetical protein LTR17_010804 [Elasticomyces elasticus]|nr:hypothetical protein LTR17_010804 [Elasticomyces elasticus]